MNAAAFQSGAGIAPGNFALVFALIAAGAVLLWAAYIVLRLGEDTLAGRIRLEKSVQYKVRMLILVMLLIALLN